MMGSTDIMLQYLPRTPLRMRFELSSQTTSVLRRPIADAVTTIHSSNTTDPDPILGLSGDFSLADHLVPSEGR